MLGTCPETAHLEVLHYVDDPLGMLIAGCWNLIGTGEDAACARPLAVT